MLAACHKVRCLRVFMDQNMSNNCCLSIIGRFAKRPGAPMPPKLPRHPQDSQEQPAVVVLPPVVYGMAVRARHLPPMIHSGGACEHDRLATCGGTTAAMPDCTSSQCQQDDFDSEISSAQVGEAVAQCAFFTRIYKTIFIL